MGIGKIWDEKFSKEGYLYGKRPNMYLQYIIEKLPPQSEILFLGEGEGRNACFAAKLGHICHAVDASEVGLKKLDAFAKECSVKIDTRLQDLKTWEPEQSYDAVLCSFLHLEEPLRTRTFIKALGALRQNGVFAGEFFAKSQLQRDSGGPKDEKLLYDLHSFEKLKRPGFVCEQLETAAVELDEGKGHQGTADVVRVRFRREKFYKIELPSLTLAALLERSASMFSERPALRTLDGSVVLTYGDVGTRIRALQEELASRGIGFGDKIALCSENMPYWGIVYLAVTTMGAVIVPILPDFHDNEIRHIILHAECRAAFVSKKMRDVLDHESMRDLGCVMLVDTLAPDETLCERLNENSMLKKGTEQLNRLKESAMDLAHIGSGKIASELCEDDLAAIIYTSGTTGSSKGVMHTHRALAFQATGAQCVIEIFPEDRFLSILPLAHTFECSVGFLVPFANGSSVTYLSKAPTPRLLIDAMGKVRPTFMLSVPLVIEKIFKNRIQPNFMKNALIRRLYRFAFIRKKLHALAGKKLMQTFGGALRFYGIGGAPLSPLVEEFLIEAGFPYSIGYGLTETAPLLAGAAPFRTKYRAIGPALDAVELKIVDPNEAGEGTVYAKGPNVMLGYYKDPEKSAEVLMGDGWFNTEDLGYIDEDGYLFISGRSKNLILGPSGENIYPEQIEAVIGENELVEDVLVYQYENRLVARVYLDYEKLDQMFGIKSMSESEVHERIEALLERLRQETNARVSRFSRISRMIEQKEPFIKTPTKKIKRYLYTEA